MVYVDNMQAPFGRMIMCHMIADSTPELLAMADRIGGSKEVDTVCRHTPREHFDICLTKRAKAVAAGAKELTWREAGELAMKRRVASTSPS